jgi:predicted ATP-grasp superfamily ATP-dependent carboligase
VKIAILEFLCGGGLSDEFAAGESVTNISPLGDLAREGWLMLECLALDLAQCGHEVSTCLDPAVVQNYQFHVLAQQGIRNRALRSENAWLDQWIRVANENDLTVLVAPELDSQLSRCARALREQGNRVQLSSPAFLDAASDKQETARLLQAAQVRTPLTCKADESAGRLDQHLRESSGMAYTLKRRDGAGCADMWYFSHRMALLDWVDAHVDSASPHWIVQPWCHGRHASLALIVDANGCMQLVGGVEQCIDIEFQSATRDVGRVIYRGGRGPLPGVSQSSMYEFADRVLAAMPRGALGWIGIDFLLPKNQQALSEWICIEVNPRLTTSYLGYRQWYGSDLADALIACKSLRSCSPQAHIDFAP